MTEDSGNVTGDSGHGHGRKSVTSNQNGRSRSVGTTGHVQSESVVNLVRNTHQSLARSAGIEKLELEVYSDNVAAVRLYESFGFRQEGLKVRGRKLEGRYQDVELMAVWLSAHRDEA
jgi:hypothetical protein